MNVGRCLIFFLIILHNCLPTMTGVARAAQLGATELERFFTEALLKDSPLPVEQLQVDNFSVRPEQVTVPAGKVTYRTEGGRRGPFLGKKTLDLVIVVNGQDAATVRATGNLQLYGDVVCVTRRMQRGELLTAADLTVVHRNISNLGARLVVAPQVAIGKQLKVAVQPGTHLYTDQLEEPVLVRRGDLVTLIVQSDTIKLSAPGQAKEDAARGEVVRVKNLMSRKDVYGRVSGVGTVAVEY